jgi:UDP-N-acetylglucosamine:LPS N-acetylglucosamine transferase
MLVVVGSLLHDASRLDAMSQAARRLARPEAAKKIAKLVLGLVGS